MLNKIYDQDKIEKKPILSCCFIEIHIKTRYKRSLSCPDAFEKCRSGQDAKEAYLVLILYKISDQDKIENKPILS